MKEKNKLDREELKRLAKVDTNIFSESLPLQHEMSYYISKDPDYGLVFEDALVFSFVKLVGKALDGESKVLFLTKDSDFDVEKVLAKLREANVEIYFDSGECLQRIKEDLRV